MGKSAENSGAKKDRRSGLRLDEGKPLLFVFDKIVSEIFSRHFLRIYMLIF